MKITENKIALGRKRFCTDMFEIIQYMLLILREFLSSLCALLSPFLQGK